jgi:hypothetical protein
MRRPSLAAVQASGERLVELAVRRCPDSRLENRALQPPAYVVARPQQCPIYHISFCAHHRIYARIKCIADPGPRTRFPAHKSLKRKILYAWRYPVDVNFVVFG